MDHRFGGVLCEPEYVFVVGDLESLRYAYGVGFCSYRHYTGEPVIRDVSDRVCKRYLLLVPVPSTSFRDRLNVVLPDAQLKGDYIGGFCVMVSKNGHSLHIGDPDSHEERVGRTPTSAADDDDVEVVPTPAGPS